MKKTIALSLLLAASSVGAWDDFTGQQAPSITVETWFNQSEGATLEDFRGKVVLLEFWATW